MKRHNNNNNLNSTKLTALVFFACLSLGGCSNINNQDVGVLSGGAIGGALGSLFGHGSGKILAAVGGTVAGAFIGGHIGHTMDRVDSLSLQNAINTAPNRQTSSWQNPNTGNSYSVTPLKTYHIKARPCRTYTMRATVGSKRQTIYGRACRMSDGTWKTQR